MRVSNDAPFCAVCTQPRDVEKVDFAAPAPVVARISSHGKFFRLGSAAWRLKGLTYGPFSPNGEGAHLPPDVQMREDLRHIRRLGANCVRLYHVPDRAFLDQAIESGLRVFIDVPWDKHRCFLEDWAAQVAAVAKVRKTAKELGTHPALFAISVCNEIPKDVVRFYGAARVQRFLDSLLDTVKQEAPDCLTTYTNYPSTEFLVPARQDFHCFNVYLEDAQVLGRYLDHLHHVAGSLPLVLGEYGIDSIRHGLDRQADVLRRHVREVHAHGLAGSFVFSYTDDWFTGGHRIEDWAFGVTDRQRQEKPAAAAVREAWADDSIAATELDVPMVSVVVCSYNGSATLRPCLESLARLHYPRYEVILVDDGSTDQTPQIAADFPAVRYIRQDNQGLSAARNVGAVAARGDVVAYTDDDCMADEEWLRYLVRAMRQQQVEVMGGPNFPPPTDNWVAKCVAASPGGPSHVMLDDQRAEHVPGCNMAFRRDKLLALGGFDRQFRVAGDDVDICWRFMDAGMSIGYAPSALVWHRRRTTVGAYLRQQKGYGRAESMLRFKHPHRFTAMGCSRWQGVIYGEGAVGLPVREPVVYHGRFGAGLFQSIYHRQEYSLWAYVTLLEWHALALLVALVAIHAPALALVSALMWSASVTAAVRAAGRAPLANGAPRWCRLLVFALYLMQPVVRSWQRYRCRLNGKRLPNVLCPSRRIRACAKRVSPSAQDLYWESDQSRGREAFLEALQQQAERAGWRGHFGDEWRSHDAELFGDLWHDVRIHTATEELGGGNRFTRVRFTLRPTVAAWVVTGAVTAWVALALINTDGLAILGPCMLPLVLALLLRRSRRFCGDAVARLVWRAGRAARLRPVLLKPRESAARPEAFTEAPELELCAE